MSYNRGDVAWDIKGGVLRPVIVLFRWTDGTYTILRGTQKEKVYLNSLRSEKESLEWLEHC